MINEQRSSCTPQVIGRLSDCYGRRPLLLASSLATAALRLNVALNPSLTSVWLAKLADALVRASDSVVCSALADLAEGDETALAGSRGLVWSMQGLAAGAGERQRRSIHCAWSACGSC